MIRRPLALLAGAALALGIAACGGSSSHSSTSTSAATTPTAVKHHHSKRHRGHRHKKPHHKAAPAHHRTRKHRRTSTATTTASTTTATSRTSYTTSETNTLRPSAKPAPAPKNTTLRIMAMKSGALMFSKKALTAPAGRITIKFTNQAPESHNFTLEKGSTILAHTPTFSGGTKTISVTLEKGTYTFLCTVPGHAQAGMKGTLVVT